MFVDGEKPWSLEESSTDSLLLQCVSRESAGRSMCLVSVADLARAKSMGVFRNITVKKTGNSHRKKD